MEEDVKLDSKAYIKTMGCENGCARFPWSPIAIYMPIGYYMFHEANSPFLEKSTTQEAEGAVR